MSGPEIVKGNLSNGVGMELKDGRIVIIAAFVDPLAARLFAQSASASVKGHPHIKGAVLVKL